MGDDDDDAAIPGRGSEAASADTCDDYLAADTALDAMFSTEAPDEIMAAYEASGVGPNLDALEADPPEEVADEVAAVAAAIRELGETGDAAAMEQVDPAPISAYYFENCDFETIAVTASEYAFDGIPDELAAGVTGIEARERRRTKLHEIVILQAQRGRRRSPSKSCSRCRKRSRPSWSRSSRRRGRTRATRAYTGRRFRARRVHRSSAWSAQGTTSEDEQGDGAPHATLGMVTEFTVA